MTDDRDIARNRPYDRSRNRKNGIGLAILAALLLIGGFMLYANTGERVADNRSTTTGMSTGEPNKPAFPNSANPPENKR